MRGWTLLLLAGPVLAGCESNAGKSTPAATTSKSAASTAPAANSANLTQVVLEVPGMTGPIGGTSKVRSALGTLQFVEKDKIDTDIKTKHVTFNVEKSKWDFDKVKAAIADKGFKDVKLISGPGA